MITTIAQRLSLMWHRLSPLEEQLFAAVRTVLPAPAVSIFDAQVRGITRVQRLPQWTEIDYYRRRFGKADWDRVPLFPRRTEFPLARVRFSIDTRRYRATLSCIGGHIFDFGITPGPQRVAFAAWDRPPATELLSDPLRTDAETPRREIPRAWQNVLETAEVTAAATAGWTLYDARTARTVTLDQGEFLVLAERDGGDGFILHRVEPASAGLFLLAPHDGTPEPIRGDVVAILRRRPSP